MRLFIAIELPGEVRDYLFSIKNNFQNSAKVNWTAKKNLHLTLKFLGEVKEDLVPEIISLLKTVEFRKFELELNELGVFPNRNYFKILWVGINNFNKVIELQQEIEEKLSKYFSKDKEFSCHITIGRIKSLKDRKLFLESLNTPVNKIKFIVNCFYLYKSDLTKDGPKYKKIDTFL